MTKLHCIRLFYYSYIIGNIKIKKKCIVDIGNWLGHETAFYAESFFGAFTLKISYLPIRGRFFCFPHILKEQDDLSPKCTCICAVGGGGAVVSVAASVI